jgi:hypothetical protein
MAPVSAAPRLSVRPVIGPLSVRPRPDWFADLGPALVAAAWHLALLAGHVLAHGGDLSSLVYVGANRIHQAPFQAAIRSSFPYDGCDGQFYYVLGQSPLARQGEGIDHPAARQLRILYPALSWLVSGGDPHRLLWAMPLVNLLAIAGMAWCGAALARRHGLSPWLGCLLPVAVNAGMPALRDLSDVLAACAVAALLLSWLRKSSAGVLLAAAAALFCREQNLVPVLVVLGAALGGRSRRLALGLAVVLGLWGAWVAYLTAVYGAPPFLPAHGNFTVPFGGMLQRWALLTGPGGSWAHIPLHAVCLLWLSGQMLLIGLVWRWRPERVVLLTALAGAGLAACGGWSMYGDSWSYTRVFAWLPLGLWFACVQARRLWPMVPLCAVPCLLAVLGVCQQWCGVGDPSPPRSAYTAPPVSLSRCRSVSFPLVESTAPAGPPPATSVGR